jgi:hypothetical protein
MLEDTDIIDDRGNHRYMMINCTSNSRALCTSVKQVANHFCELSDLLSTTTTCFSKLIAYEIGVHLVAKTSFNLAPTVVLQQALSVRRARSQSKKTACPKMPMSIIMTC